jgi:hypothetical protein
MKLTIRALVAPALLASMVLAGHGAFAQTTATVAETGTIAGVTTNLQLPVNNVRDYFVGSQNITVNGSSFLAYCVDPFQYASGTPATYNVYSGFAETQFVGQRATDMTTLYSQYFASTSGNATQVNNRNSAAFQLALWELANDDGVLTAGGVQRTGSTDSDVVTLASTMITNAKTGIAGPTQYAFTIYEHTTQQDFLVSVTAVPEPETYAMLLTGLGFVGVVARRRKGSAVTV